VLYSEIISKRGEQNMYESIQKRDGRLVPFDASKITTAIAKAGAATGEFDEKMARRLTVRVLNRAEDLLGNRTPSVEEIQDIVRRSSCLPPTG